MGVHVAPEYAVGYATGQLEGHLLLWGANGTGKTTVAELLPYAISGATACIENISFEELLNKKDIESYLLLACSFAQTTGSSKLFLIMHEFDNAKGNVSKLWTAMDKCGGDLMAIITTNKPMLIDQSIRSRFDCIEFPSLKAQQVLTRAQLILKSEGVSLSDYQVLHYLKQEEMHGDWRKYCKRLDETVFMRNSGLALPPVPSSNAANQPVFTVVNNCAV